MGKQKNTALEDKMRWHLLPLLHKECVRRNEEYARELRKAEKQPDHETQQVWFMDLQERWALWLCPPLPNPDKRPKVQVSSENSESNPLHKFEEDSDPIENPVEDYLLGAMNENWTELGKTIRGFACLLYFPEEEGTPILRAALDLKRPKKEIKKFLEQLVDEMFERREKNHLKQINSPGRRHFEADFECLRVWDLREKNKKYEDIIKIIWPGQEKTAPHVNKCLKKAEELIKNPPLFGYFKSYLEQRLLNRQMATDDNNPPMIVPKRKAKLHGDIFINQLMNQRRMRLGKSLMRSRMPEDEILIED